MWHGAGQLGLDSWGWTVGARCNFLLTYIAYIMREAFCARVCGVGHVGTFFRVFSLSKGLV